MIVGPDIYVGGWPDREKVCQDAMRPFANLLSVYTIDPNTQQQVQVMNPDSTPRRPYLCSYIPDNFNDLLPVVRFYRGGGASDQGKLMDQASVQIGVIAATRDDGWWILEYLRQMMLALPRSGGAVKRADGSTTSVTAVSEIDGPEMIPELNPDNRLVVHTLAVTCRLPRELPDYGPFVTQIMADA
ncbi:MAG TPA: hypothetical protein VK537_08515 [Galbitalea sp.]|nr:hypothetical protein [Galbitalea sp.]